MSVTLGSQLLFVLVTEKQLSKKGPPMMRVGRATPTEKAMPLILEFDRAASESNTVRAGLYGWSPATGLSRVYFRDENGTVHREPMVHNPDDQTPHTRAAVQEVIAYLRTQNVKRLLAPLYNGDPNEPEASAPATFDAPEE